MVPVTIVSTAHKASRQAMVAAPIIDRREIPIMSLHSCTAGSLKVPHMRQGTVDGAAF